MEESFKELEAAVWELCDLWFDFRREMDRNVDCVDKGLLLLHQTPFALYGPRLDYRTLCRQSDALRASLDRTCRAIEDYYKHNE